MNKNGFTLVELLAVITIMALIMALAFPSITGLINSNKQKKYESYEKTITEYAKAYLEEYPRIGTFNLSNLKEMLDNNELAGLDQSCEGYIDLVDNYKAYIRCDDYTSSGFNDDYLY